MRRSAGRQTLCQRGDDFRCLELQGRTQTIGLRGDHQIVVRPRGSVRFGMIAFKLNF